MDHAPLLSLVLPTYQEAENILPALRAAAAALKGVDAEILVVDDDSPDGTWRLAEEESRRDPRVRAIRRTADRGLSAAVLAGFEAARGRLLGVMDADLSHDAALLPALVRAVQEGADVAVGSRRVPGGGADHWPWFRRTLSSGATLLTRLITGAPVRDPMSGYFILRREVYERVKPRVRPRGYKVLLEILGRAGSVKVREIPYVFRDRRSGHSKLTFSVALGFLEMLVDLRFGIAPLDRLRSARRRPQKKD